MAPDDPRDDPHDAVVEAVVEVRRSARRRRTVSAYRDGDRVVVLMPARLTRAEERQWVDRMLVRLNSRSGGAARGTPHWQSGRVSCPKRYLHGRARPSSVAWVNNQNRRWGSCSPADGTIRLSSRLLGMPTWVVDYVLLHELAHLIERDHSARFWALLDSYPRTERARGYLEGHSAATGRAGGADREADEADQDDDQDDAAPPT